MEDVKWEDLTQDQQSGMTREYWENDLIAEQRRAFLDQRCVLPDCEQDRWNEIGSLYCREHTNVYDRMQWLQEER